MILPCKDGKRHWWLDGWVCEKCGLRRVDYDNAVKAVKRAAKEPLRNTEEFKEA